MPFAFKHVVVSGTNINVEGVSLTINLMTDFLVNDLGWTLVDDRRAQASNVNLSSTHKVVLSTNGESAAEPTWYVTLASGLNATQGSNVIGCFLTNAYDVAAHDVPGSGVQVPAVRVGTGSVQASFTTNGHFNLWMSGDKDGVTMVWNAANTINHWAFGRSRHFLDNTLEPFGLYFSYGTSANPTNASVRAIVGNPPIALPTTSQSEFITVSLSSNNEPRTGLGEIDPSFAILPLVHNATNGAGQRGSIGIVSNLWTVVPQGTSGGSINGTILTSRTSGRKYLVFAATGQSLAMRIE